MPDLNFHHTRKRSYDDEADEPAPKRVTRQNGAVPLRQDAPRLPVPNLTISTTQTYMNGSTPTSFSQNVLLLPPLNGRAMSTVYPSTPTWQSQLPMVTSTGTQNPQGPTSTSGYVTPSRRHSRIQLMICCRWAPRPYLPTSQVTTRATSALRSISSSGRLRTNPFGTLTHFSTPHRLLRCMTTR